jgi:hypothetical protein
MYCTTLLFLSAAMVLTTAHALRCQSFQQPTAEELSMTTDPKAPGVDAVYLYREETADDNLHYHSIYVRLKVLTEKGKEQATVRIPYEKGESKVVGLKGRTIHADGTVIPMTVKPADLLAFKQGVSQFNDIVFTLPDVAVGSIIEYKLDVEYGESWLYSPRWEVQQPFYVHKAHYWFWPYHWNVRLMYETMLPNKSVLKEDSQGRYEMNLTDIPATAHEEWSPPMSTFNWHVYFYYTGAKSADAFWEQQGSDWRKSVDRFIKPDSKLKDAVSTLVGGQDTEEQKAQKLFAAVMKLENTDYTRHKTEAERKAAKEKEPRNADDVWKQKSGTSDELALLYVALVNTAGLKAWPMLVTDRNRMMFDINYLSMWQLEDIIAVVSVNGKDVFLDPGVKFCDYGELNWKHLYTAGLRVSADYKSAAISGTPLGNTYEKAAVQRQANVTVDENGELKGVAQYVMTGPDALKWRQLNLTDGGDEVKKQFNELLRDELPEGVHGELDHFVGIDEAGVKLIAQFSLSGNMGTTTGKRFILPGLFFESHSKHLFVSQTQRITPVDMHFARMTLDSVNYRLPEGYQVESSPTESDVTWPNNAMLRIKSTMKDGVLNVGRLYARNFIFVKNTDYQQLHDFYTKMATADQQQIVLTRAASVPKGN